MFTTAAQLLDLTDKKLVLVLRDGRKLVGILRSWDQFANLVLQDTVEKVYAGNLFAEQKRGIYIVRGENVLLLGEIVRFTLHPLPITTRYLPAMLISPCEQDLDKEDELPPNYQPGEWEHVCALKEAEDAERKKLNNNRGKQLHTLGFEAEHSGEALF
ncbi:Like-Sm ribonucleoprotein (LSM)-related domain protein [Ascosphaera apis ARSEF 7405]|uniref:U6 snRNA-associated Sm-like protein LSm1 n=1 Tax=Ascosphaera apis ARSEF 7405 TaxID=392613 RepID=A0A167V480_9EURO|nr:Like-Sm ribonucleoprotein (LSM)-related domain protein [Ascosphaera apis ARSEF 7405]